MAKILLVDDVYTARSMIERVLRHVGRYEVYSVDNGSEALTVAEANPATKVRSHILCSVVAYTVRTERDPSEFVSQGFSAYVSKNGNLSM